MYYTYGCTYKIKVDKVYMEFSSRGFQRNNTTKQTSTGTGVPVTSPKEPVHKKTFNKLKSSPIGSLLGMVLFASALILFLAIIFGISTRSSESSYVQKDEYQAVFLEGGQVYFGKLKSMKDNHLNLVDVYYLNVNDQNVQPEQDSAAQQNLSLIKLGCELHGPRDQMIINREHVLFWENLKNDSRVAEAIKEWQNQNKDGQKCDEQSATQPSASSESSDQTTNSDDADANSSTSQNNTTQNNTTSNGSTSNSPVTAPPTNNSGSAATPNGSSTPSGTPTP